MGVAETKLKGDDQLQIPGFSWIGQNRTELHVRATTGSGGVGLLIADGVTTDFTASVLDSSTEGILWVKLSHRVENFSICVAVCYLPPEYTTRNVDGEAFFDTLLYQVYMYQKEGPFMIIGDFNARCGVDQDYVEGVDDVTERHVVDTGHNSFGDPFIQFLLSASCCMINGRNYEANDYTSVSQKGLAVVDYCLVAHEHLALFDKFRVQRARTLFNEAGCLTLFDPSHTVPDHSLLSWSMDLSPFINDSGESARAENTEPYKKFQVGNIPENFMMDTVTVNSVQTCIERLSQQQIKQDVVDEIYKDFCGATNACMGAELPSKVIYPAKEHKRYKRGKPWWCDELTELWSLFCEAEQAWSQCRPGPQKQRLKHTLRLRQKDFDRVVQRCKRTYWRSQQERILELQSDNPRQFWQEVNRISVGAERRRAIPMEVYAEDGTVETDRPSVLSKWREDFEGLLNPVGNAAPLPEFNPPVTAPDTAVMELNRPITVREIDLALRHAKNGKASGPDSLPVEVLRNVTARKFMHVLFHKCLQSGTIPTSWKHAIITPIPKSISSDPRVPLNYRGITLSSCMYKLYGSILNRRLSEWADTHGLLVDEQNGFRGGRSCVDHLTTLCSIIETRKTLRQSTYTAFIDFSKAFDRVDRRLLWYKLEKLGLSGNILRSLQAIYSEVKCAVRLHGMTTDWFNVNSGVKQGCILSPLLFSMYLNDLALEIKALGCGVDVGGEQVSLLLYADDIVFVAPSAGDLQHMLDVLYHWCERWNMVVNPDKSKVVHFRNPSVARTQESFSCGPLDIGITPQYKYLGLTLTEHLDYTVTATDVATAAGRALGCLIAKSKTYGGLPFNCFTKLYDSLVLPIIMYGAAVWGTREYSCINAIHNRACRFFLGVPKHTPNLAVQGDMGWKIPWHHQWLAVAKNWFRLVKMNNDRINHRVFTWAHELAGRNKRNWVHRIVRFYRDLHMDHLANINYEFSRGDLEDLSQVLSEVNEQKWHVEVNRDRARRGPGRNKLRTYCTFKSVFETEHYCQIIMSRTHRSAFARFRAGVAPIRLETGRFERLPEQERTCPLCSTAVETEKHVFLDCAAYEDIRNFLYEKIMQINNQFQVLSEQDKLGFIFNNNDITRHSAKACYDILQRRRQLLYTTNQS